MSAPVHVIEAAFDAAWERYEAATCKAATLEAQPDLFDQAKAEAREWLGILHVCGRELRHG